MDIVISCSAAFWLYILESLNHAVRMEESIKIEELSAIKMNLKSVKDKKIFYASIVFLIKIKKSQLLNNFSLLKMNALVF